MSKKYQPPPLWEKPSSKEPSPSFQGEKTTSTIHEAVGRSLSMWEHMESAFIKLFQLFCETKSLAACRAYGTSESIFSRYLALKYAAEEFFTSRDSGDLQLTLSLLNTYKEIGEYRNQIAHGMAMSPHGYGYFLCPPSYSSRRRKTPIPTKLWGLGAKYIYRVAEIDRFRDRFEQVLNSTMSLVLYLNEKYSVLDDKDFHP